MRGVQLAWEWVGPTATASVGVLGFAANLLIAQAGRKQVEFVTQLNIEHQEKMAREQRLQTRLSDAYIDLLVVVERLGLWAARVRTASTSEAFEGDSNPSREEQAKAQALINAYGSKTVKALSITWIQRCQKIQDIDARISSLGTPTTRNAGASNEFWILISELEDTARPKEASAREALIDQISVELSQTRPSAETNQQEVRQ